MMTLLHHILFNQAKQSPEAPALGHKNQWFTYEAVAKQTMQVAAGLQALNLKRCDRVQYIYKNFLKPYLASLASPLLPVLWCLSIQY